ncbi:MAG: hypothetical protein KAX10_02850 [Candidatus Lokiarchaeota archaeon]|nr:hypothetical protein [Candidatus Lokiarchaeota archaeon]
MEKHKELYSINEIDGVTSISSPHKKELKEIGRRKANTFRTLTEEQLKNVTKNIIGGTLENTGLNEDWTITKTFFPDVKIHTIYFYYGDEFGSNETDQLKFFFSDERVRWIPGEDLANFINIMMNYAERVISNKEPFESVKDKQSKMLKNAIDERKQPFDFIIDEDIPNIAEFIGGTFIKYKDFWELNKEIFPGITIRIKYTENHELIPLILGVKSDMLENYEKDLLRILTINHILRYITIKYDERDLPEICKKMFAPGYLKQK